MVLSAVAVIILNYWIYLIATRYRRFYSHYCQETEPFTRHFSRIREAFPWAWWGLEAALAVFSGLTAHYAPYLWCVVGMEGLVFMGWFIWHIEDYTRAHKGDNPPLCINWLWRK